MIYISCECFTPNTSRRTVLIATGAMSSLLSFSSSNMKAERVAPWLKPVRDDEGSQIFRAVSWNALANLAKLVAMLVPTLSAAVFYRRSQYSELLYTRLFQPNNFEHGENPIADRNIRTCLFLMSSRMHRIIITHEIYFGLEICAIAAPAESCD